MVWSLLNRVLLITGLYFVIAGFFHEHNSNENSSNSLKEGETSQSKPNPSHENYMLTWSYKSDCGITDVYGEQSVAYTVTEKYKIVALNAKNGSPIWSAQLPETTNINSSLKILITGKSQPLYVATHSGNLYAVNKKNGKILWRFRFSKTSLSSPSIGSNGFIYLGFETNSGKGKFIAFNPLSKKLVWEHETEGFVQFRSAFDSKKIIYYGTTKGAIYARQANSGRLKWISRSKITPPFWEEVSAPLIHGQMNRLYVSISARQPKVIPLYGNLRCFDTARGKLIWEKNCSNGVHTSVVQGKSGILIFSPETTSFLALDSHTGKIQWTADSNSSGSQPILIPRGKVVFSTQSMIIAYDLVSGTLVWSIPIVDGVSQMTQDEGCAIIFTTRDRIVVNALR